MQSPENPSAIRLNKYISSTGYCSRREADALIESGRVSVNGRIGVLGDKVTDQDQITVNGKPLRPSSKAPVYLALHKPVGITCTTERHIRGNVIDFIGYPERIFPIGRLDKDSEGLLFLTSDGDIVNKILRAGNQHEKEYIVTVDRPVTDTFVRRMAKGVPILSTTTLPCKVNKEGPYVFRIILTQGLNRQIRRMCSQLGYTVKRLKRIRIMNVTLDGLPLGKWRLLTPTELATIHQLVADSTKTEEGSLLDWVGDD